MRAIRDAFRGCEVPRRKSKNRRVRCVFCPSRGADPLILDCDRLRVLRRAHGPINDCIVIEWHGTPHVAVVELKGRSYSAGHTRSQLAAGAGLIMDMLGKLGLGRGACYRLVVVAPSHSCPQRNSLC